MMIERNPFYAREEKNWSSFVSPSKYLKVGKINITATSFDRNLRFIVTGDVTISQQVTAVFLPIIVDSLKLYVSLSIVNYARSTPSITFWLRASNTLVFVFVISWSGYWNSLLVCCPAYLLCLMTVSEICHQNNNILSQDLWLMCSKSINFSPLPYPQPTYH